MLGVSCARAALRPEQDEAQRGPHVRALRVDDQAHVHLTDSCKEPAPGAGELLVKVSRVLLTHEDAVAAGLAARPLSAPTFVGTLGHLVVGTVKRSEWLAATGANSSAAAPAGASGRVVGSNALQRVAIAPSIACGHCPMCRGGLSPHCRSRIVIGLCGRDGGCAEHIAAPITSILPIPDGVTDDQAVFTHPIARALHAGHVIRSENKAYVTVIGDSLIALLTAQTLARVNKSVRLLSTLPDRARVCERWGIRHRPLHEAGLRQDQDAVVDCTGRVSGLMRALHMVRPRGTVLLQSPLAMFPHPIGRAPALAHGTLAVPEAPGAEAARGEGGGGGTLNAARNEASSAGECLEIAASNEVHVVGCREGPLPDAFGLLLEGAGGGIDVSSLSTSRCKLEQSIAALNALRDPNALGYLIDPEAR